MPSYTWHLQAARFLWTPAQSRQAHRLQHHRLVRLVAAGEGHCIQQLLARGLRQAGEVELCHQDLNQLDTPEGGRGEGGGTSGGMGLWLETVRRVWVWCLARLPFLAPFISDPDLLQKMDSCQSNWMHCHATTVAVVSLPFEKLVRQFVQLRSGGSHVSQSPARRPHRSITAGSAANVVAECSQAAIQRTTCSGPGSPLSRPRHLVQLVVNIWNRSREGEGSRREGGRLATPEPKGKLTTNVKKWPSSPRLRRLVTLVVIANPPQKGWWGLGQNNQSL